MGQRRVQSACAQRELKNIPIPENALTRCNWNSATSPNVATRNLSIIDCMGILVAILSYRRGSYFGIMLGSSGALFSLIVFLVIFFLELSPADAKDPIPVMIFGYFAVAIIIAAIEIQKLRKAEIRQGLARFLLSASGLLKFTRKTGC